MKHRTQVIVSLILALIFTFCSVPATVALAADAAAQETAAGTEGENAGEGGENGGSGETPGTPETPETPVIPEPPQDIPPVFDDVHNGNSGVEWLNLAGYKYSTRDNYFYVDRGSAWQGNFGYSSAYDYVAPYLLLEYDYVRVHFTYEGRDWLVQLWKGQYGLAFYGSELGFYTKEASGNNDTPLSVYKPVSGDYMPWAQTVLYHDPAHVGAYSKEFTTPFEQTWWSTGFKSGHLTVEEPANELRQNAVVTFANTELAQLFANGLRECGFAEQADRNSLTTDSFCVEGRNVYYSWQDISEAENTMGVKVAVGTLIFLHFATFAAAVLALLAGLMGMGFLMILI